jgi:AraC family transcriptional regulator
MKRLRVLNFDEVRWAQKDGGPPETFAAERPPGESGVSLLRARFNGAVHFSASTHQHLIFFQMSSPSTRMECRIGGRRLRHDTDLGSLAICPAGVDCSAEADSSVDALLIVVQPGPLALAAAEDAALDARLNERLSGDDPRLLAAASRLARESASGYPNGALQWSEAASRFLSRLVRGHTSTSDDPVRGRLGNDILQKIRNYILANLAEPIDVGNLAALAGRSEFHFTRVFARSVGMTPYRYVVHLRLQAAIEQIRSGTSLADVAASTGFSDQSHLSRWIRRVHGVAPSELA